MYFLSKLNLSLKTKIIFVSVLVELVLLSLLVWNDTAQTQSRLITAKEQAISDIATLISSAVATDIANNSSGDIPDLLLRIEKSPRINYVAIKTVDGATLAESGSSEESNSSSWDLFPQRKYSGITGSHRITVPIEKQNTAMGQLLLEFNTRDIDELSAAIQNRGITNAALIVICTIILLYIFVGALTKNLKNLTTAVTEYIDTKKINIPVKKTNDEIGRLTETFLRLVSTVRSGEDSLHEREHTLQAILDNSPAVIYVKDKQGKYLLANNRLADLLNLKNQEILGKTDFELFPHDVALQLKQNDQEVLASHSVKQIEEIVPSSDGEPQHYLSVKFCLFDKNNQEYAVCGISTDISERIRNERLIRQNEENLSSLANSAFDGILVNQHGKHVFTNQRMADLIGTTVEEILSSSMEFVVHPSELENVRQRFKRRMQGNNEPMQYETLFANKKTGEPVPVEIAAFISQWQGEPTGVVFVRDIRERKQAVAELIRYRQQLETLVSERTAELQTAIQELESFSYSVSHDLRSPLRSIDGFSQLLLEDYGDKLDNNGKDYLSRVRKAAQHMAQLIDDILLLSRVSRYKLSISEINLSTMAMESITTLQELQPAREADVKIEPNITAKGDQRLLKIVLDNLLGNAWKYTGKCDKAIIEFGQRKENNKTVYYVKDNGVGFEMQYAEKMFGPFQRLHTLDEFPGTGIGLATVKRIIQHHNGEIWAEGKLGEGATFYFTLGSSG